MLQLKGIRAAPWSKIEGGYDGERTLEGFQSWVASKQEAKEL